MAAKDLIGVRCGQLTVVARAENYVATGGKQRSRWLCRCDCGKYATVLGINLQESGKRPVRSCGCSRFISEASLSSLPKARNAATVKREDFRRREARLERERNEAALLLQEALGYVTGGSR